VAIIVINDEIAEQMLQNLVQFFILEIITFKKKRFSRYVKPYLVIVSTKTVLFYLKNCKAK